MTTKDKPDFPPTFLYHADKAKDGVIFTDQEAHDAALEDGYVDTPAKFGAAEVAPTKTKKK